MPNRSSFWDFLPHLVPRWNNYGGPSWTAGMDDGVMFDLPAMNKPDAYFQQHEFGYYRAQFEVNPARARREADRILSAQLRAPEVRRKRTRATLVMLKQLRRTIDCEAGYIEFK